MIRKSIRPITVLGLALGLFAWALAARPAAAQVGGTCEGEGRVAGRVTDAAGERVEGAAVVLLDLEATAIGGRFYTAETDADGSYELEGVCEGGYYAFADLEEGEQAGQGFFDPDGDGMPDQVTISEDAATVEDVDISLEPMEPGRGGGGGGVIEPGRPCADGPGSIEGRILDGDGQAVAGALVGIQGPRSTLEVRSDADGVYRGEGLCEAGYLVLVFDESASPPRMGVYDADGDGLPDYVVLDEDAPAATDIDVVVEDARTGGGSIGGPRPGGRCEAPEGSVSGRILDADGKPARSAKVILSPAAMVVRSHYEVETGPNGKYEIEEVCPGTYWLQAWLETDQGLATGIHDADGDGQPDPITIDADTTEWVDIDVVLGQPRPVVTIGPWPSDPVCEDPEASIAGRVTDETGAAVSGAQVLLLSDRGSSVEIETDAAGAYRADGLCSGEYLALAIAPGGSATQAGFGFYDADGDGVPDPIRIAADDGRVADVDIILTDRWEPIVAGGAVGVGDCPDCLRLDPIIPARGSMH